MGLIDINYWPQQCLLRPPGAPGCQEDEAGCSRAGATPAPIPSGTHPLGLYATICQSLHPVQAASCTVPCSGISELRLHLTSWTRPSTSCRPASSGSHRPASGGSRRPSCSKSGAGETDTGRHLLDSEGKCARLRRALSSSMA